ncbi:hypothetical protein [Yinghuangia soli]|uniref:Uncharacterized protein n=1 Tax=Yinghuangia soli TaxID=2908204 RepID=A0AA41U1K0_9ACTN|nr:hypothetical protein [Yinghuangia soli]MCF2529635.1 hypothetical protein [Yinghuangia soli]
MAKNKAKPHLQNKSALFTDAADRGQEARAQETDTLVAENNEAQQNRRAKGRKQSRGSDGPGRRRS